MTTDRARAPRSFKHRRGRITAGQRAALSSLWSQYGLDVSPDRLDLTAVFGRHAPVALEIGFGMGETTLAMAVADPATDVIAVDVHTPGAGALLRGLEAAGSTNVRVVVGDAVDVLTDMVGSASLAEVRVFFPDPWPKARHHKRRLFTPAFAAVVADRLAVGGRLHAATDWAAYAAQMLAVVAGEPLLVNPHEGFAPRPPWRPVTRYERHGVAQGRQIADIVAYRQALDPAAAHPPPSPAPAPAPALTPRLPPQAPSPSPTPSDRKLGGESRHVDLKMTPTRRPTRDLQVGGRAGLRPRVTMCAATSPTRAV